MPLSVGSNVATTSDGPSEEKVCATEAVPASTATVATSSPAATNVTFPAAATGCTLAERVTSSPTFAPAGPVTSTVVAMADTVTARVPTDPAYADGPGPDEPVEAGEETPAELLARADQLFAEADAARADSLADYETKVNEARALVAQALEILEAGGG